MAASAVLTLLPTPRPFLPVVNAAFGNVVAQQMVRLVAAGEK
jgi:hypothetical protein